jgi:hypothetical protein
MENFDQEALVFHVTLRENLDSVRLHGLIPHLGDRAGLAGESAPSVFLYPTREDLDRDMLKAFGQHFSPEADLVFLEIAIPDGLMTLEDERDGVQIWSVVDTIPFECVREIYDQTWMPDSFDTPAPAPMQHPLPPVFGVVSEFGIQAFKP